LAENHDDARRFAPAAARNRDPIRDVLSEILPKRGHVLEVASGSGEHVVHLAAAHPDLTFQPSDPDAAACRSVDAWVRHHGLSNVAAAMQLDARAAFPELSANTVLCINMIHIAPWSATEGLMRGAAQVLNPGGCLVLYGPFHEGGKQTGDGNVAFDERLRSEDPEWGLRDLNEVAQLAGADGFDDPTVIAMPANNLTVVWRLKTA